MPYLLWGLFRYALQACGLLCLYALARIPQHLPRCRMLAETLYHVFTTLTLAFAIQARPARLRCAARRPTRHHASPRRLSLRLATARLVQTTRRPTN